MALNSVPERVQESKASLYKATYKTANVGQDAVRSCATGNAGEGLRTYVLLTRAHVLQYSRSGKVGNRSKYSYNES